MKSLKCWMPPELSQFSRERFQSKCIAPGFPRSQNLEANWAWAFVRNPGQTGRPAPSPVSPAIPVDPAGPRRDSDLLMSWNVCEPNTWCGHSCLPRRDRLGPPSSFHDRVKSYTPVRPVLSTPGPILPANATRSFSADTEHFWAFTLTALPIGLGSSSPLGPRNVSLSPLLVDVCNFGPFFATTSANPGSSLVTEWNFIWKRSTSKF